MYNIVLYCKSYSKDVQRVKILLDSVKQHNKEKIPFYVSVPSEDIELFKSVLGTDAYVLISDEDIMHKSLFQSWKNQQIVKMMFWKLGLCKNYVVLDSDCYFIKDFFESDFIHHDDVPYTVMHEQKDLFTWTSRYTKELGFDPIKSFGECRYPIMELFERKGRLYDFGPIPVIWSSKVWESLEENYNKPNNLTFESLIDTISSEFSWYGESLLTWKAIELWPIEPMFKVFHYLRQYHEFKQMGYTQEQWSKTYIGLVMQSSSGLPLKY